MRFGNRIIIFDIKRHGIMGDPEAVVSGETVAGD